MGWDWRKHFTAARDAMAQEALSHADEKQWDQVESIADAGVLNARWLEGDMGTHPSGRGRPPKETECIIQPLAKLNRSGFLTVEYQPGEGPEVGYNGKLWTERANVQGLADSRVADTIQNRSNAAGLWSVRHDGTGRGNANGTVPVTRCGDEIVVESGSRLSRRDIDIDLGGHLVPELSAAQQLSIVDPVWGRNDMWSTLTDVPALELHQDNQEQGRERE